ncbi:MAG: c-type cytochrome [Acidobacteria bacterium]|nr:c-type cytochrome [Acidobacteriota bacterium]
MSPVTMRRRWAALAAGIACGGWLANATPAPSTAPATTLADRDGWRVPVDALELRNPLAPSKEVLARGARTYRSRCQRCHGPAGRGDGPEADPERRPGDLSDPARAARNPDGVIFYKIWNGRRRPTMPAFSVDLSADEVWEVVHYVATLRR